MKIYQAPMEGITGYIFRRTQAKWFGGIDQYYMPFISPKQSCLMNHRELEDVAIEHNKGMNVIPQILAKDTDLFMDTARELKKLGYLEINLNAGCPSKTVVTKGKGSGMLNDPEELEQFLLTVTEKLKEENMTLSVKTRIGMQEEWEWEDLINVYNKFSLSSLIVHPRLQNEYYKGEPHRTLYRNIKSKNPLCYNGDLFSAKQVEAFLKEQEQVEQIMIGRGLLVNPNLAIQIKTGQLCDKEKLYQFHKELCQGYEEIMSGERNVLFKMKELWFYMIYSFVDAEKMAKKIKKTSSLSEYKILVDRLFKEYELRW